MGDRRSGRAGASARVHPTTVCSFGRELSAVGRTKLSPRQETHLVALHHAGTHTSAELAELFSVARSTVYRAIERERTATASGS